MKNKNHISILHINTHDTVGGTAAVAQMLISSQEEFDWHCSMLVGQKTGNAENVFQIRTAGLDDPGKYYRQGYLYYDVFSSFLIENLSLFEQADIIHMHNLHGWYFNPFAIAYLSSLKPIVWTLHDMQSFTGHCAHSFDCDRFQVGCQGCPHLDTEPALEVDTSARLLADKKLIYDNSKLHIVTPSNWLAGKVSKSILKDKPLDVICNGVDTNIFKPADRLAIRQKLNIPSDSLVFCFSANGGVDNPWRDGRCIAEAVKYFSGRYGSVFFLNIGSGNNSFNMPNTINIPHVKEQKIMAGLYSASDIMLFPTLADNCPLAVIEATACGCVPVSYRTGGVPELIEHDKTGVIVDPEDSNGFIKAVERLCDNRDLLSRFKSAGIKKASDELSKSLMVEKYNQLYGKLISESQKPKKTFVTINTEVANRQIPVKVTPDMLGKSDYLQQLNGRRDLCDVSVVLCTMDRAPLLDNMLSSLPAAAEGLNYEVVVVAGNSDDNTLEVLRKHNITKIYNEAEYLGNGKHSWPQLYNFAFSKAHGKWAMFASDDIIFEPGCLLNAFAELQNQPDSVAGGLFFYKNLWERPRREPFDREKYFIGMGREFNVLMNYGLLRLDYFRHVGGFDENYSFYYADSDLCNRLYSQGEILIPLGKSLITHDDKLDRLKQVNVQRVEQDLALYASRWQGSYIDETNRPHRLVWQKELAEDYSLPIENADSFASMQLYWRGLAFYQRADFARSCQMFAQAIQNNCNHWKVYCYLGLSAFGCGEKELAVKAAGRAISMSNNNSAAKKLLSKIRDSQSASTETIGGLIFSKDRPIQLRATVKSFINCCDGSDKVKLHVLYKATNSLYMRQYEKLEKEFADIIFVRETDFKKDVQRVISGFEYILFLVDDNIFVSDFKIDSVVDNLKANLDSLGFSLRLGTNTGYCYAKNSPQPLPSFEQVDRGVLKFAWTSAVLDFNYPLEVSSSVYRTEDLLGLIAQLRFNNPNMFEGLMALNAKFFAGNKRNLLCFDKSVTFCNPVNVVQSVASNRSADRADYSANSLSDMFEKGYEIDVSRYKGFVPNSCHQEAELYFKLSGSEILSQGVKLSVEMVAYNAEKYIGRAIESVLAQDFTNFELIIVNDGSTDNTESVIKLFKDDRIKYILRPHQGCAAARNTAISAAAGEYILCVDSDDFIAADYISSMLNYIERNPGFDYYYPQKLVLVDSNGEAMGSSWDYQDFSDNRILPAVLFANGFSPVPNPASLIRTDVFSRCGLYEDVRTVEDFVFLCRNALNIKFKMAQVGSVYFYRYLQSSASKNFEPRDRIIADTLNRMVQDYSLEIVCPSLSSVASPAAKKLSYFKYVSDVFYKHANGHHLVKFGDYYRRFGDYYRDKFSKLAQNSQSSVMSK